MAFADGPLLAPAKINLALHVTGRRDDGYHLLETLVVFSDFGDMITVSDSVADRFDVSGPFATALADGKPNLVELARDRLRANAANETGPVAITLDKRLPVASGLGGGSSDAATCLDALARRWGVDSAVSDRVSQSLGADVPMCRVARPLIATGVGERISQLKAFPALAMVLVNPLQPVSTPAVFRKLDGRSGGGLPPLPSTIEAGALPAWLAETRNDLEAPALTLLPAIGDVLDMLKGTGASFARMSGSGATCYGLHPDMAAATVAAEAVAERHPDWFVRAVSTMPAAAMEDA